MRRLWKDESGMTMGLVVIMVVLIGVMGAGLLTFVSRDLNTVVEVNQGQRAFEVADAGIGVAKRQLSANVARTKYDDPSGAPVDDIQWSAARGGLTLNDLDGDGPSGTPDSVNVTIEYNAETMDFPEHFLVTSTGTYGEAKRRIEATFNGVEAAAGGENIGHPLYYTPSDIRIEAGVTLNAISMFTESDILIEGVTDPLSFVNEYESSGGTISIPNANDELCNWNSDTPLNNCFEDATGPWNTAGRTITKANGSVEDFQEPGFAAEGKLCGFPTGSSAGNCDALTSAADGVYGYDSTTGAKVMSRTGYAQPWGNNLAFVAKGNLEPNPAGTITYPFPRPTPIPEGFKEEACRPLALTACTPALNNDYFVGSPTTTDWNNLLDASNPQRIAFVDAQNQTINFNPTSGNTKGILVVWCGHLQQAKKFQGIILNLHGDGSAFGSTNCAGNDNLGTYRNNGQDCQCWMYADGGTATRAGITLANGSKVFFLPSGDWSFLSNLFEAPPPTSFALQGWRELYK